MRTSPIGSTSAYLMHLKKPPCSFNPVHHHDQSQPPRSLACPRAGAERCDERRCRPGSCQRRPGDQHDRAAIHAGHGAWRGALPFHGQNTGLRTGRGWPWARRVSGHARHGSLEPHGHDSWRLVCHLVGLGSGLRRAHPHGRGPGLHHRRTQCEHRARPDPQNHPRAG